MTYCRNLLELYLEWFGELMGGWGALLTPCSLLPSGTAAIKSYKTVSKRKRKKERKKQQKKTTTTTTKNRNNSVKENYHKNKTKQTTANVPQNMTHNNVTFRKKYK